MTVEEIISKAIENKHIIIFNYNGHFRRVEPHHYGFLNNKLQLHAYQIAGTSRSGNLGWKNFEIDKIEKLSVQKSDHFVQRKSHHPNNANYAEIKKSI